MENILIRHCAKMSDYGWENRKGGRRGKIGKEETSSVLRRSPLLRIVYATNNYPRPSNPSHWSGAAGRLEEGGAAVGAAFIKQTAGAEP